MRPPLFTATVALLTVMLGCGNTEVISAEGTAASVSADPDTIRRGQIMFLRCRSCHTVEKDGPHLTGPNLNGLFGAKAGSKSGYPFSDALSSSNITWDSDTLDEWLKAPSTYVPQNRMVFAGMPNESDRAALIAYLAQITQ